jgi:uncharacterized GH25 family protein
MTRFKRLAGAGLLLLSMAPALRAHDFWMEPSPFTPEPGERVAVRLRVGEHFQGDPVALNPRRAERFAVIGASGESPVEGAAPGGDPAGLVALDAPGLYHLVYDSSRASIELAGPEFEKYLAEEGLERISRLRAERGQTAAKAREVFSRCAKSLVAVGGKGAGGHDRVLGLPLELVPEASPSSLTRGGSLPVRLLQEGKPLEGALVVALRRGEPARRISARTDAGGRVMLSLDLPGVWLVKAVHMVPAPEETGADWESFWASLTFEVPAG